MHHRIGLTAPALAAAALLLLLGARGASADQVYVALGDSITFGETDLRYAVSNGDRGYVALVANSLAASNGGVRPDVVNLAIDGETTTSFQSGGGRVAPVAGRTDAVLAAENSNYDPANPGSQGAKFLATVAAEKAAGNTIGTVSISLGFNDLATQVGASNSSVAAELAAYQRSYGQVLAEIRQQLPTANLLVLDYYNPFAADPTNPAAPLFNAYGGQLNGIIRGLSATYGATFVDDAPAFVGHEAEYTYLAQQPHGTVMSDPFGGVEPLGDIHPNQLGYEAIARSIFAAPAAAVPAPSAALMMGSGIFLFLFGRRRRFAWRMG